MLNILYRIESLMVKKQWPSRLYSRSRNKSKQWLNLKRQFSSPQEYDKCSFPANTTTLRVPRPFEYHNDDRRQEHSFTITNTYSWMFAIAANRKTEPKILCDL